MVMQSGSTGLEQSAHWTSRIAFLLASVGFAVGLGNIWRFPYVTGENGGAAFVVVYLFCVFAIGVPILMAELFIGRRGGCRRLAVCRRWRSRANAARVGVG